MVLDQMYVIGYMFFAYSLPAEPTQLCLWTRWFAPHRRPTAAPLSLHVGGHCR